MTTPGELAQMDVGPMVPDLLMVVGIFIVPLTAVVWGWFIWGGRRSQLTAILVPVLTVLTLLWMLAELDDRFYEPHLSLEEAELTIENLPAVKNYLAAGPRRWCRFEDLDHKPPDEALHTIEFRVGDADETWHRFRINLIDGSILVADPSRRWLPLNSWQSASDASH